MYWWNLLTIGRGDTTHRAPPSKGSHHHLRLQNHYGFRNILASKSFRAKIVEIHRRLFFHCYTIFSSLKKKSNQTREENQKIAPMKLSHVVTHRYKATVVWEKYWHLSQGVHFLNSSVLFFKFLYKFQVVLAQTKHIKCVKTNCIALPSKVFTEYPVVATSKRFWQRTSIPFIQGRHC